MQALQDFFRTEFGSDPAVTVRAPGRLELLGNHTDYNEGLVMAITVDRFVFIGASPRADGWIELVSSAFPGREMFRADQIEKNPATPWANYVKGVLLELRKSGARIGGFNAAIHATLPLGGGMSSSAALEVATALAVRKLFPGLFAALDAPAKMELARLCQRAECEFVGANVGPLDQISSLFGRRNCVLQLDCRHFTVGHDPMPDDVAVVVCDSGVKHDLTAGHYNRLRTECEAAAKTLGIPALRSISPEDLVRRRTKLTPRQHECAMHITGENARVTEGARALRTGEMERFGRCLFESHASSRDLFRNSCPELDLLVELSAKHPACLGARLTGGGFGGCTLHLVRAAEAQDFAGWMEQECFRKAGRPLTPLICGTADGAE